MDLGELDAILSCNFMSREGICIDPQARTVTARDARRGGRKLALPVALAAWDDPATSRFSFRVVLTRPAEQLNAIQVRSSNLRRHTAAAMTSRACSTWAQQDNSWIVRGATPGNLEGGTRPAAHLGSAKVYLQLVDKVYWRNLKRDDENWVHSCTTSQAAKIYKQKRTGEPHSHTVPADHRKFQVVSVDILSGFPRTTQRHDAIFVMVDSFSGHATLAATSKTATSQQL
eukprot:762849-Hanusia_phi.AAC.1